MEITLSLTDIFMIIAGISIMLIMIYLLPLLIQLRKTACHAEKLIENINQDLPKILDSLKSTTSEIKLLSEHINTIVAETDAIISTAKNAGESLLITSNFIRSALAPAIKKIDGISSRIKSFLNIFQRHKSKITKETQSDE